MKRDVSNKNKIITPNKINIKKGFLSNLRNKPKELELPIIR